MPEPIDPAPAAQLNTISRSLMEAEVVEQLRQIYDPEIPVNIYDLGLIYDVKVDEDANVVVTMTLTSPNCPVAESLPIDAENAAASAAGVKSAKVELVWDPPFSIDRIPEHIRLDLGLF